MMHYISTRGQAAPSSFSDIVLEGLASDGGLYVPEVWPQISFGELESWRSLSYAEMVACLLFKFAPGLSFQELLHLAEQAYTPDVFCHARSKDEAEKIFPVLSLDHDLHLLQLSNGPTLAFKDAAMQMLGHLIADLLEKRDSHLTLLGSTSGDTGSAAIHALRGKPRINVVMLSPDGCMSDFQRAQMYSVLDDNIINLAVRGMFDDCQELVKTLNADKAFKAKHHLGAVNSINWARVVLQSAYYISAYLQVVTEIGQSVSFSIPSGNFGNAFACFVARSIGVPIHNIIVATNENDVLHRLFQTGCYEPSGQAFVTSSPSMDITKASNFERIVFEATGRDGALVASMWARLARDGRLDLAHDYPEVWAQLSSFGFLSSTNSHDGRLDYIKRAYEQWGLSLDPHTADGLRGALYHKVDQEPMIFLETAQAAKFAPTFFEALGIYPSVPEAFENLLSLPQRVEVIDPDPCLLKEKLAAFV